MPTTPQGSALQQYTRTYGQRLQSLIAPGAAAAPGITDTASVLGRPADGPTPAPQQSPFAQPPQPQGPTPDQSMLDQPPPQQQQSGGKPTSVDDLFKQMPDHEQKKQAADLEDALKRGGQTVDGAYDDLVKQMGTRPDEGLSKEEKSMLIIKFGLSLMSNSAASAHGQDFGAALGAAGTDTLNSYQQVKGARARQWDSNRSALETARTKDKVDLAKTATTEELKNDSLLPKDVNPVERKADRFVGGDGFYYEAGSDGTAHKVMDADGKPLKAPAKDITGAAGEKPEKVFEFDHRQKSYMEARGYDWNGKPLNDDLQPIKGDELRKMRQKATEFAGDTKNASLSDSEVMQQAQRAVDEQMRFSQDLYRDYSPAEYEKERQKLVKQRVSEIGAGRDPAAAAPTPPPSRSPFDLQPGGEGSPFASPQTTTPPAESLVAGKARRIKGFEGRWTLVNGKPSRVD